MSGFAEYEHYDALGLADLVRRRQVTADELLDAAIVRVEARNPSVNAVVMKLYDYGRQAITAGLPDGPLTGVPFLVKDLSAALAGVPTHPSAGHVAAEARLDRHDAGRCAGILAPRFHLLAIHRVVQHHRATSHRLTSGTNRRWPAAVGAARGPLRR